VFETAIPTSTGFRQVEVDAMRAVGFSISDIEGELAALGHAGCGDPERGTQNLIVDMKQGTVLPVGGRRSLSEWFSPEPGDTHGHVSHWGLVTVQNSAGYRVSVLHAMCRMGEGSEARDQDGYYVTNCQSSAFHRILLDYLSLENRADAGSLLTEASRCPLDPTLPDLLLLVSNSDRASDVTAHKPDAMPIYTRQPVGGWNVLYSGKVGTTVADLAVSLEA
jgi:hypothetical protein